MEEKRLLNEEELAQVAGGGRSEEKGTHLSDDDLENAA